MDKSDIEVTIRALAVLGILEENMGNSVAARRATSAMGKFQSCLDDLKRHDRVMIGINRDLEVTDDRR